MGLAAFFPTFFARARRTMTRRRLDGSCPSAWNQSNERRSYQTWTKLPCPTGRQSGPNIWRLLGSGKTGSIGKKRGGVQIARHGQHASLQVLAGRAVQKMTDSTGVPGTLFQKVAPWKTPTTSEANRDTISGRAMTGRVEKKRQAAKTLQPCRPTRFPLATVVDHTARYGIHGIHALI